MATGRLSDTNPEAWYRLAVQMDQNRVADEAFQASYRQIQPPTTVPPRAPLTYRSGAPTRFAHSNPSLGNPVPMDIDAARRATTLSEACRRCRKPSHQAKECHLRFDVRFMDADELEELLLMKHTALDAVPPDVPDEADLVVSMQDFVSRSG